MLLVGFAQTSRTIHDLGLPIQNRLDQRRVITRIVLHIRILNDDDISGCMRDRSADRGAFPLVLPVPEQHNIRDLLKSGECSIGRTIVHHHNFLANFTNIHPPHRFNQARNSALLIEHRDQNG